MSSTKKIILVYSNLPSGGAKTTEQSTTKYLEKFYEVKRISEPKYHITNIFQYFYVALVASPNNQKKLLTSSGYFDLLLIYQSWLIKSPSIMRYTKKPKLYVCHDVLREYYDEKHIKLQTIKERFINLLRFPVKILDKFNIQTSNATIISNSIFSQKLIYKAYSLKSKVIYPGVDSKKYLLRKKLKKLNQVVSIGAINKLKMQSYYVDVIARIPLAIRPTLVLICNGVDKSYLSTLIKKSKKFGVTVKILINITEKRKISELNKSKAFLYSGVNEPFGIAVEEAIASGLPLIVYGKGGGYTEIVNRNMGIVLNNLEEDIWAKALISVIINNQLQKKYSAYNIVYASKYLTANIMNRRILSLIKKNL